jgi:hypothetical protein
MNSQDIKTNLSQAIYDLSVYEFKDGKPILSDYPSESQASSLKEIKRLRAYIHKYLKLFNELSQEQKGDFLISERAEFLKQARILK